MKFKDAATNAGLPVKSGKQALKAEYRAQLRDSNGARISASVDLDAHWAGTEPGSCRWDYGVGVVKSVECAIWIEAHPASSPSEVDLVLSKLRWLQAKLATPEYADLQNLTNNSIAKKIIPFRWVYSGTSAFRSGGKEQKKLAKHGMKLPERSLHI